MLKDYSFSKSIDPLITDTSIFSSLNSDIKEFIKIQIESGIASKGYYLLTGFDFFTPNESDSLRITPKEINNSTHDSNTIFTTRGVVIDFNYEELQFTLAIDEEENMPEASVEHSKTKMKFYFADDELLSANQEAYFHRYKYSPQPVITVHYVALPLGNFVCLDKMEEIDVRSPQASG